MLKWAFRLLLIAFLTAAIGGLMALFKSPNWPVAAGAAVVFYFVMGFALKTVFSRLLTIPFMAKGKVLRGATAEVHSVQATTKPERPSYEDEDEEEDEEAWVEDEEEDEGPKAYYQIDVTITPQPQRGAFSLWSPDELMLVPLDTPSGMKGFEEAEEKSGSVWDFEVWDEEEGGFTSGEDIDKHGGPLRLRMVVEVPAEMREAKFQYYFESFGEVHLRGAHPVDATPGQAGLGAPASSGEEWRSMLAAEEEKHGVDSPGLLPALRKAARGYRQLEMYSEARQVYQRELAILRVHAGVDARAQGVVLNNIAGTCWHLGLVQEALEACQQALDLKRSQLGGESLEVAIAQHNLGLVYGRLGQREAAVQHLTEAVEIKSRLFDAGHPEIELSSALLAKY